MACCIIAPVPRAGSEVLEWRIPIPKAILKLLVTFASMLVRILYRS